MVLELVQVKRVNVIKCSSKKNNVQEELHLKVVATTSLLKLGIVILLVTVSLLIASYLLSMFVGLALFFTPAGIEFGLGSNVPLFYFLVLWVIFVLCFVAAWKMRKSFREVVSKAFRSPFLKLFDNWLLAMPIIASTLLFIVSSIIDLQNLVNVPTGGLPVPVTDAETFALYLDLTRAPVIEELAFRVIPLGIIVLSRLLLVQGNDGGRVKSVKQKLKLFLFSFLFPDKAKGLVGAENVETRGIVKGIGKEEWLILLFTSVIFAVAHILSGIGWQFGKVTSSFVQGFVFSLVFLAYGVQAGILLHWFFNYYFYTFELGNYYLSLNVGFFSWIEPLTLFIGAVFSIIFIFLWLRRLVSKKL
jgi:hypothetical protein